MKKVYTIEGLDCANCAAKLERKFNEHPLVEEAVLTFATKQLRIVAENPDSLLSELQAIADKMEEGVVIRQRMRGEYKTFSSSEHKHHDHHCCCGDGEHDHHHHSHCDGFAHKEEHAEESHKANARKIKLTRNQKEILLVVLGVAVFILAKVLTSVLSNPYIPVLTYIISYLILGGEIVFSALRNLFKGKVFDENFLMSIATIGAFIIGDYPEAVGVMLFFRIGELFEEIAVEKSRGQIMDAVDMRPETVTLWKSDAQQIVIASEEAKIGDKIIVRPGDRIPLDGVVLEGESRLDTSPITGEPVPVRVTAGSEVLSGCVNTSGVLIIQVEKQLEESMVTRILDAVENAAANKPGIDRFITRFARIYTPFVVVLALFTAIVPSLFTGNWEHWIYTALTFLVISCPCALVLSVPLAFFAGIGAGSKKGILFKGGAALEALQKVKAVVMDKTGTITEGNFVVQKVCCVKGVEPDYLLSLAAGCEEHSTHPIAQSVMEYAKQQGIKKAEVSDIKELAGKGIQANVAGHTVLCGNQKLLLSQGVQIEEYRNALKGQDASGSEVLVAYDGRYIGYLLISDTIKKDSMQAISFMNRKGLITAMLTGDSEKSAQDVAAQTQIAKVYARLLPENKCRKLDEIRQEYGNVMFVGDGINDAPVLAGADVGAAMGSGADAAIEAADVVFMNSSLMAVPQAIHIADKACTISKENVIFALAVKALVMILGLFGMASMWMAVFADSGVAMLCVLNSIRILYERKTFTFF